MKKTLLIFFIFLSISCFAQFSKTHYIPPLSGSNSVTAQEQYLYISTPSVTPVNVKINAIGVGITNVTVSQNSPKEYYINSGPDTQLMASSILLNTPLSDKGYIIEAESLVYVAVRVMAGGYNQAGSLVSKGLSALGKEFRVGAFINTGTTNNLAARYTFLSILATENNTLVEFKIKAGVTLLNNPTVGNTPASITLNRGQSYILATEDNSIANKDGLIGALVKSNKPIAFNCGSFGGTNGNINGNLDLGFDQIVPVQNIGKEYIFVRGFGQDITERPLIVAHEDNTEVYTNSNSTPTIINAGQYLAINGIEYGTNGNMYVRATKPVFAYQSVGGSSQANQEMFFVPPLNCSTPNIVNNIPMIEQIGNEIFTTNSGLNIVTKSDAVLQIGINGVNYPISSLPFGVNISTPKMVVGPTAYVAYSLTGLSGNIGVFANKEIYVSYFGSNNNATYGGYYSGFDLKPEIISDIRIGASSNCIPNVVLKISALTAYDSFQWYFNDVAIDPIQHPDAITNTYTPDIPGFYQVKGSISGCLSDVSSDKIPVSSCPNDLDNDNANDNVDIDNDNDGITNCTESYGNLDINLSNLNAGNIAVSSYTNSFTGSISTSITASAIPFTGNADGSFVTEIPTGKTNWVTYKMAFAKPVSLGMEYISTATATDLLNAEAEYVVNSDIDKTITVVNPDNQLLIDTNYDGIYESGVNGYSSFEIRFRLNSTTPLAAGSGKFKFLTYLTNSISFTHKNLSDDISNKSSFKFFAVCVPKDFDGDGIPDQLDLDSDNDGITDNIEGQGGSFIAYTSVDINKDGLSDAYETAGLTPIDADADGVKDYLDLDSDNDGIFDSVETGNDLDADGIRNFRDLDSDQDLCSDVIEAGFLDANGDGKYGNSPITVNSNGLVMGAPYTVPNPIYLISAPIVITTQPNVPPTCELQNATITIVDDSGNTYQWQIFSGGIWTDITDNATYTGASTNTLLITQVRIAMNGYKYRVQLSKTGNSCGLISATTELTVYALPVVNPITIIQCDDDLDAKTYFNLTVKNDVISSNAANENLTYYTTLAKANAGNPAESIPTPLAFENINPPLPAPQGLMYVWARVANKITGCYSVAQLTLKVVATNIPATYNIPLPPVCDDFLDINGNNNPNNNKRDGIASFDLSSSKATIQTKLPPLSLTDFYTISYYRNQTDALSETNVITDISNYRNIGYPGTQQIWVRIDSNIDNACIGLGPFVTLTVENLPVAHAIPSYKECDEISNDGMFTFNTSTLQSTLLSGQSNVTVTYFDQNNTPLPSPFPKTFATSSQIIKARVTNNTTNTNNATPCYDETSITFIVDKHPVANPVVILPACDDAAPSDTDGLNKFDTTSIESTILNGQVGMVVKYFDSNGNSLSSPLPNPFNTATQNVKVTVENPLNTTCTEQTILHFEVNPLPNIDTNATGNDDELVCTNLPTFYVELNAGIQNGTPLTDYTYEWKKDGTTIPGETQETLKVNTEGNYTVEVSTLSGCSRTRTIKVTASDIAHLDTIKIIDLTDINSITVNVTGQGQYEYSLDDPHGPFQVSPFFENVSSGIHEVYINDKNGCGIISQTVAVLGVPKYFTPNGDGYNDYWIVKGVNSNFNTNSIIFIYDRYGKLITKINTNSEGWDGKLNGNPLPADDYWYTAKLEDGREAKGHFSLKR
jgi:gliding motility-associated-like protein